MSDSVEIPEITRAVAMRLEPGDVLFLTIEEALDEDEVKYVRAAIERELPGVKCLILMGGIDLAEVHRAEAVG